MKIFLEKLASRVSLSKEEMEIAVGKLFAEDISDSEIAAFMACLKTKGETADEIAGIVEAFRKQSRTFSEAHSGVIDNCGTGGDGSQSFNISTTSAFVIAGAGIKVAQHGNRSVSSKTGSADVLEELGAKLDLPPEKTDEMLEKNGIAFLFAPYVHPRIKQIMRVRKDLRIPTVFNLIGPLTNPVNLDYQLLGIHSKDKLDLFAQVLMKLGRKRAIVINGAGGMDEGSLSGTNSLIVIEGSETKRIELHPEDIGLPVYSNREIVGGDAKENAAILKGVLSGKRGPCFDTVLLNSAIGIYAAGKAANIQEGISLARESIDSGAALEKLESMIKDSSDKRKAVI